MARAIRREDPLTDDPAITRECARHIAPGARLSPVEQLDIYRQQFFLRHVDSLLEDFPGVNYFVGAEAFDRLAKAYLTKHPPTSCTLREVGQLLPAFLRSQADLALCGLAADMAELEWAFVEVFDAQAPPPFDPSMLAGVPADALHRAVLRLNPTLRCLALTYPVHRVREAILAGETPEAPPRENQPVNVVLFRDDLQLRYDEIEDDLLALLVELGRGTRLGEACELVASRFYGQDPAAFGERLQAALARFTRMRWLAAIELD
jgi:hypothetical protein